MASVISGTDYRAIAVEYSDAFTKQTAMKQDFFDAVYIIVQLNVIIPEVDLLQRFWGNYLVNTDSAKSKENFLSPVRVLQNHVIQRGGFATIDDYLVSEGITVPKNWADLSDAVGFTISAANID
tara:strand:+ start:1293 stop:1664 length:372 start_codon:yes stop_codon:yes gene_type:complete